MAPRVVLIGPPGAGKSSVARALARRLGLAATDTDDDVERAAGKPVASIFIDDGEAAFRELERAAVSAALADHDGVLALGGGAVMDPETEAAVKGYRDAGGTVVFLDVSLAEAAPRVGLNTARPLLLESPRAKWQALMEVRRPVYARLASVRVPTDGLRPNQIAARIAGLLVTGPDAPVADQEEAP